MPDNNEQQMLYIRFSKMKAMKVVKNLSFFTENEIGIEPDSNVEPDIAVFSDEHDSVDYKFASCQHYPSMPLYTYGGHGVTNSVRGVYFVLPRNDGCSVANRINSSDCDGNNHAHKRLSCKFSFFLLERFQNYSVQDSTVK